jgi:hypothetical protein
MPKLRIQGEESFCEAINSLALQEIGSGDISVGIATGYGLDGRGSIPAG